MKKVFLLSLMAMFAFAFSANAQYKVTLKIIDETTDRLTNSVGDENADINIYAWLDDNLQTLNPRDPGNWWYPLYDGTAVATEPVYSPVGAMYEEDGKLIWSLEVNVEAGKTYEWSPGIKSWGWKNINQYLADFGHTGNPSFSVDENGVPTGDYEVPITDDILILAYNEGTMTLAVIAPEGTSAVFVRGLYNDWGTPIAMAYDEELGLWIYDIQGDRIAEGKEEQEFKFWWTDDSWDTEEGNGSGGQLAANRTLTYEDAGTEYADDILEWLGTTGLTSVNASNYAITEISQGIAISGEFKTVKIYSSTGMLIDDVVVDGEYSKILSSGLYIIRIDNAVQKVLIK